MGSPAKLRSVTTFEFDQLVTFLFQNYRTNRKVVYPQPHCVGTIYDLENSNRRVIEENGTQSKNAIDLDKTQYLYIQTFFFGIF